MTRVPDTVDGGPNARLAVSATPTRESAGAPPIAGSRPRWRIAWCHHGDTGGSKRAAFEMVRELAIRGHVIDEFSIPDRSSKLEYLPLTAFVRRSSHTVLPRSLSPNVRPHLLGVLAGLIHDVVTTRRTARAVGRIAEEINRGPYDLVHIDHYANGRTIHLLSRLRLPAVLYSHEASKARYQASPANSSPSPGGVGRRMYGGACAMAARMRSGRRDAYDIALTRRASLALTNSAFSSGAFWERYGRQAAVCPCGVDAEVFRPLGLGVEPMVFSPGRLVAAKQHHLVVEAVARIPARRRPRVVVATPEEPTGLEDAGYSLELRRQAARKGVELAVEVSPSQRALVELYNRALAVVFVPRLEPFGLVILEAMACGTPVIGVREGGVQESIVDGVTGLLVRGNTGEVADAIERLVTEERLRGTLGRQAAAHVRAEWTWQRAIDRYEEYVGRLLAGDGVRPAEGPGGGPAAGHAPAAVKWAVGG